MNIIDSNVPLPSKLNRTWPTLRGLPFRELEVGQSFHVDRPEEMERATFQTRISALTAHISKKSNALPIPPRFITRTEGNGIRVWRVE